MENKTLEVKPVEEKAVDAKSKKEKLTPILILLENSINVWWKNLKKFVQIYLLSILYSIIPLIIIIVGSFVIPIFYKNGIGLLFTLVIGILFLLSAIIALYFFIRSYVATFLFIKNDYKSEPKNVFKEAKNFIVPYIAVSFLTVILVILWTFLLIIPGIIYSILYSFAVYVFFFEGKTGMAALKRSKELVKGYWWAVAGRFFLLALIMWIFGIIISIPMFFVPEESLVYELWSMFTQIINILVGPVALLFSYQIYQDLVKIKK
ncbi:MAG: hypothetical protein ACOYL8_00030 [Patescibacteria group bacterium]